MTDISKLLKNLGDFLQRMAIEQEEIGATIANAMQNPVSQETNLAIALQHFDRTRQNLEAVGTVMTALASGARPAAAVEPVHLEELRAWLGGERTRNAKRDDDVDLF